MKFDKLVESILKETSEDVYDQIRNHPNAEFRYAYDRLLKSGFILKTPESYVNWKGVEVYVLINPSANKRIELSTTDGQTYNPQDGSIRSVRNYLGDD